MTSSILVWPYLEVHGQLISGVISPLIRVISIITLIITLLITTHEPPSKGDVVM